MLQHLHHKLQGCGEKEILLGLEVPEPKRKILPQRIRVHIATLHTCC